RASSSPQSDARSAKKDSSRSASSGVTTSMIRPRSSRTCSSTATSGKSAVLTWTTSPSISSTSATPSPTLRTRATSGMHISANLSTRDPRRQARPEPVDPSLEPGTGAARDLEDRRIGVERADRLVEARSVEVDQVDQVDLVEHDGVAPREDIRVLHRFVVPLGRADEAHPRVLTEVPVRGTDQVSHVFDHE